MKQRLYVIKLMTNDGHTFVLGGDYRYWRATDRPMKFLTLRNAECNYLNGVSIAANTPKDVKVWIEGPRGGCYPLPNPIPKQAEYFTKNQGRYEL